MPLRDHFRPPISNRWSYAAIHGDWITMISQRLNTICQRSIKPKAANISGPLPKSMSARSRIAPLAVPLELELTYQAACRGLKIP